MYKSRRKLQKSLIQTFRRYTEILFTIPLFLKQEPCNEYIRMKLGFWKSYSEFLGKKNEMTREMDKIQCY